MLMIDATQLKAHRTASSLKKGAMTRAPRLIGRTRGGMNRCPAGHFGTKCPERGKLHAVGDGAGRPIRLHLTAGQRSDFKGADVLLPDLPPAKVLIADRGYDSAKVQKVVEDQQVEACIPSNKNRREPIPHCEATYKKRHKVENLFAKLKDWRRIALERGGFERRNRPCAGPECGGAIL